MSYLEMIFSLVLLFRSLERSPQKTAVNRERFIFWAELELACSCCKQTLIAAWSAHPFSCKVRQPLFSAVNETKFCSLSHARLSVTHDSAQWIFLYHLVLWNPHSVVFNHWTITKYRSSNFMVDWWILLKLFLEVASSDLHPHFFSQSNFSGSALFQTRKEISSLLYFPNRRSRNCPRTSSLVLILSQGICKFEDFLSRLLTPSNLTGLFLKPIWHEKKIMLTRKIIQTL